jgi:hypothetical protein
MGGASLGGLTVPVTSDDFGTFHLTEGPIGAADGRLGSSA